MESGMKPLYEIVETFIKSLYKIIAAFLALLGIDPNKKPEEGVTE